MVDIEAPMLKKHGRLSANARLLYQAMRAIADGKTGELRIGSRWYKAAEFDCAAEMCKSTRLSAMRELVEARLVSAERMRVSRIIGGRLRCVSGSMHYTVHRKPVHRDYEEPSESSRNRFQESVSSTVEESDPQVFSNPPLGADGSAAGCGKVRRQNGAESSHQSHPPTDERSRARTNSCRKSKIETAKTILLRRGLDRHFMNIAIARVEDLARAKRKIPRSAQYFVVSVERALEDREERVKILQILADREEAGIASEAPLKATEKHYASMIAMVHEAVEEGCRCGRPAEEVMAERLALEDRIQKSLNGHGDTASVSSC